MTIELDHVLICASPGAPEGDRLVEAGFREGSPNRHPGQGTANRRFFFANAFLELIWVENESEARSDLVAPTRLWDRWRWRETGTSPFGICLRPTGDDATSPPFDTFAYTPPYLPAGVSIPIATDTHLWEPMLFINTMSRRPDTAPDVERQPLGHPNGARQITHARLGIPYIDVSAPLTRLIREGFVSTGFSPAHVLELSLDEKRHGHRLDLQPELPLILHW
jgi:hypothetical protein